MSAMKKKGGLKKSKETIHSVLTENLFVSVAKDEDPNRDKGLSEEDRLLCLEVEKLGWTVDVFEFAATIGPLTKDKGDALSKVLDEEFVHFRSFIESTFEIKNKDFSELLARQECKLKEQYCNWVQRVRFFTKKNNQWLNDHVPNFNWDEYFANPASYIENVFHADTTNMAEREREDENMKKWRTQNFHKLVWLKDQGKRLQDGNEALRLELDSLQRQFHDKQTLITMHGQIKHEKKAQLQKQAKDLRTKRNALDDKINKLFKVLEGKD